MPPRTRTVVLERVGREGPLEVSLPVSITEEMVDRAVRELHRHLEGFVCHLPVDDPDWRYYAIAVLRAAFTGEQTEEFR